MTEEYSDLSATETFYPTITDNIHDRMVKNYETIIKLIDNKCSIIPIFRDIVMNNEITTQNIKTYKDSRQMEIYRLPQGSLLYKGLPWFYPHTMTHMEVKESDNFPHLFSSIKPATKVALILGGGINAYKTSKELRLLCLNDHNYKLIMNEYVNNLTKNKKSDNIEYYNYIKNKMSKIQEASTSDRMEVLNFLSNLTNALGYDGTYCSGSTAIYDSTEYMINRSTLTERIPTNDYDWHSWDIIPEFIIPIETFNLNLAGYIQKNIGFSVYNFYKKMLLPSVKITDKFDFATLDVNNFQSINAKDSKSACMKACIDLMKEYDLRFICLQNATDLSDDIDLGNLHVSTRGKCTVISTSKVSIDSSDDNHMIFTHPHFRGKTMANVVSNVPNITSDVIMGITGNKRKDYALNDMDLEPTSPNNITDNYILTKLPKVLPICMSINYKYSNHRIVIAKYI